MNDTTRKVIVVCANQSPQAQIDIVKQRLNALAYDTNMSKGLDDQMYEFVCVLAMNMCDDLERRQVYDLLLQDETCRKLLIQYVDNVEELALMYNFSPEEQHEAWFGEQVSDYIFKINLFFTVLSQRPEWEEEFKNIMRSFRQDFIERCQKESEVDIELELS